MHYLYWHATDIIQALLGGWISREDGDLVANIEQGLDAAEDAITLGAEIVAGPLGHEVKDIHGRNQLLSGVWKRIITYSHRRMYIQPEHYMELLKKSEELAAQNQVLLRENELLAQELLREKTANYELMQRFGYLQAKGDSQTMQVMAQSDALHCDLKGSVEKVGREQRLFLQSKFNQLETSAFEKYRVLEVKNRVGRIENHELNAFLDKIKKNYFANTHATQQPSLKDLGKWVKALCGQAIKGGKGKEQTSSSWRQVGKENGS